MTTFVYLAAIFEVAVVKDIREYESNLLIVHTLTTCASHAVVIEILSDVFVARLIFRVQLERGANHFGFLTIQHNGLGTLVI
ncbi:MAG: hypothetical protein WC217_02560 [Candidatus Paceibacterota bacterium]